MKSPAHLAACCLFSLWPSLGPAASGPLAETPAQLDARGQEGYRVFLATPTPRAFALAPGGAWGYATEALSSALAEQEALAHCQANTRQRCLVYAVDHVKVLGPAEWAKSLAPYPSAAQAARAVEGTGLGQRFPDLVFRDAKGRRLKLSDLRGQVVVLHFWGSWCPPCQREMPELAGLVEATDKTRGLRFVFLQVREDAATAQAWARRISPQLPLYDAGAARGEFTLADGRRIPDRALARAFPTSFVIDPRGLVLFSRTGPVAGWLDYLPVLRDAAAHAGK
ncbi:MAG: TlpA family protein disulfide reductase [Pseudomonadota bacterium]